MAPTMKYASLMEERLSEKIYQLLISIGHVGSITGCKAFAVGGFVRDLLLGRSNLDIDIVIEGDGISFAQSFAEYYELSSKQSAKVKAHQRFGTAVVIMPDGIKIDFATARKETYVKPGSLPYVSNGSIDDDLYRRDFTINAMAINLSEKAFGELVDIYNGFSDLENRSIRVIHKLSFIDDPTRIFRAIRFEQRYGFIIEPHTESLARRAISMGSLKTITIQRLRNEILLILKEDEPLPALHRMENFGLLGYISPSLCISDDLFLKVKESIEWWNSESSDYHEVADPVLLNLMALLDQFSVSETDNISRSLLMVNRYSETLTASKDKLLIAMKNLEEKGSLPSGVYDSLRGFSLELLLFARSKFDDASLKDRISNYLTRLRKIKPLVNGSDLHKLGYPEGPLYSQILSESFALQLDGVIKNKTEAIKLIKSRWDTSSRN